MVPITFSLPPVVEEEDEEEGETLEQITEQMMSSDEDGDVIMTRSHDRDLFRTLGDTLDATGVTVSTPDQTPRAPPLVVIIHYLEFYNSAAAQLEDISQVNIRVV